MCVNLFILFSLFAFVFRFQSPLFILISDNSTGVQRKEACIVQDGRLEFCAYTPPGHYQLTLDFRNAERNLHFIPVTIDVNLFDGPVFDLMFTRFRAKLVGRVRCLSATCWGRTDEAPLTVRLIESVNPQTVRYGSLTPVKNEPLVAHFTLDNLLPGDYFIDLVHRSQQTAHSIPVDGWCWANGTSEYDAGYVTPNSTRLLHIRDEDLDWKTEPKLDFTQSGYVVRVQLHSQLHFDRLPRITVRAIGSLKADNTTSSIEWDLMDYSNQVCLPSPSTTYRFTQLNPCLSLSFTSTSEVRPERDCHAQLDQSPLVRLTVTKIPLFVRLAYRDSFTFEAQALLTKHSIPIEVSETELDVRVNVEGKSKIIFANWSTSANSQLFAMASFELDPTHSVRFTPKHVTTKGLRWLYTYLVSEPSSSLFQIPIELAEPTPTAVVSLLVPLNHKDAVSVAPDEETCSNLFHGQTTQFTLNLAVVLRGQVEPAVPKVEVELYRKFWKSDNLRPESDQPLLPIDVEKQPVNLSTEPSVVPAHDLPYDSGNNSEPVATTLTNPVGVFLFGPVPLRSVHPAETSHLTLPDPRNEYTVTLRKPGYEFIRQDPDLDDNSPSIWIFKATKLSLVEVVVHTKIGSETNTVPLPDVLVSIIGEGHRGNQFTGPNGVANFVGLAPGQYYLRAMMKEHVFTVIKPEAQSAGQASAISITEGDSIRVEISAERVAFSVSGVVTGLGGVPFEHVMVQATWLPQLPDNPNWMTFSDSSNASCQLDSVEDSAAVPQEQAYTDSNGEFRIRGLFPGCYYAIAVRPTPPSEIYSQSSVDTESDNKPLIDQAIPPVIHFVMPSRDATGLSFIAIPQMYMSSFTVDVESDDEFVSTLHLTVHPLDRPDQIVAKHDFADSVLFMLPPSKMNSVVGRDMVVRLTTSLDPTIYTNIAVQQVVLKPTIDNGVHHTFVFRPKLRPSSSNWPRSEL
ncbi:hypothetical protein PHET_05504 [Paragonimus heterotremus]|uniref:Nodal modulator 2 n=1 Tax=Paragonimus heterotremus TaxID=100268 RepID=A0A8J4WD53_9TREM|nr:hypothetical protein PHET_05503 [Paragonimus heterotremus]KAF5395215.1 hypothetical protein PHET_05504 [Paragonimus heterotremus]